MLISLRISSAPAPKDSFIFILVYQLGFDRYVVLSDKSMSSLFLSPCIVKTFSYEEIVAHSAKEKVLRAKFGFNVPLWELEWPMNIYIINE